MVTPVARRKFSQRRGGGVVFIQRGSEVGGAFPARADREGAPDAEDRRANGGGLRDGGGDAGSDRVGMRVHLALAKLNVSQILLRTQSGVGSHIRGCL